MHRPDSVPRPNLQAEAARLGSHGIAPEIQSRFAAYLAESADRELYHFNPRYLAERLGLDERAALKLLLAALYEGLVALHWDVRCPVCGATDPRRSSLGELHHDFQCGICGSKSAARIDDEVRVTFSPHARLRALPPAADDPIFRAGVDARLGPVSGHAMLLLPDFMRLMPQERLLPEESLEVTRVALIFTDLAGSTALYASRGDPRAYHLVRLHFDELLRAADAESGTVIKTIGDAILAAFQTPVEALRAALGMQNNIAALNDREQLAGEESLILKVGLHVGPCLSVTLNDRPDYFGATVNVASRVQGLSRGGDIVFTETLRADPEAQAVLGDCPLESDSVTLKGIGEAVAVHRLAID